MKKVSMIIVSYNERQYLSQAIESCLNQKNLKEYEIIIGDDGSSDGSIELIKEYAEKYPNIISFFVMKRDNVVVNNIIPSIRVSNVMKRAFELSTGQYIMVMSGDDKNIDDMRVSTQISFLDNNPCYQSCYCDYKMFWEDGQERNIVARNSLKQSVFWGGAYVHISCFLFRRLCLENLLKRFCDDTGMLFSIFKTGKSKYITCMGFGYRQREKSIMHEADKMELHLLELLLMQDCLNEGGLKMSTYARFFKSLKFVFSNRGMLNNEKFNKYLCEADRYDNNIVGKFKEYDKKNQFEKIKLKKLMVCAFLDRCVFSFLRRIGSL